MKRSNWLDVIAAGTGTSNFLTPRLRAMLASLDEILFETWNLGDNIILVWTRNDGGFRFLWVRHYAILEPFQSSEVLSQELDDPSEFINEILAGPKFVLPHEFDRVCGILGKASSVLHRMFEDIEPSHNELITRLVTRYGVSLVRERAVVLLDAVGFSLHSPLEQVAMLNSISYSVNSAYRQLLSKDIDINFARTTTGDGFYIWNRSRTTDASKELYKLMMLILADNAIARRKAKRFPVPKLRAAFHVGEHYEFYQVEALNPTAFAYIVGQVTIDLSRMIETALPGQILLGNFRIEMSGSSSSAISCETPSFVEETAATLTQMEGLLVGEDYIEKIHCYLTGERVADGQFRVNRYDIRDKHGLSRVAFNAKINILLNKSSPIFLGVQHGDLHPPGRTAWPGG